MSDATNHMAVPTPSVKSAEAPKPPTPSPTLPRPASIATAVNQGVSAGIQIPKGLARFNTNELSSRWFHCIIYGETDARKSTTAATFGSPEQVRIIQTRRVEQLIGLEGDGYEGVVADTGDKLEFAMNYPEKIWPEWAKRDDRVLVLDDATSAKDILLDENSISSSGAEIRDNRRIHVGAKRDMQELIKVAMRKPQHLVVVCLAKVASNDLTGEEIVAPDLPPAMLNMLNTDFEDVFFIKKGAGTTPYQFLTEEDRMTFQKKDEKTGELKTYSRRIFGKKKLPRRAVGALSKYEPLDLQAVWQKIVAARAK